MAKTTMNDVMLGYASPAIDKLEAQGKIAPLFAALDFGDQLRLNQQSPALQTIRDRAGGLLGGLNPAARAAAVQRAENQGLLRLAPISSEFFQNLFRMIQDLKQSRSSINTTTPGAAFLRGFAGGGGGTSLAGMFGGGNANGTSSGNPFANMDFGTGGGNSSIDQYFSF